MHHQSKQAAAPAAPRGKRLARPAQVAVYLGVSRSTLYSWMRSRKDFPKPIPIGERAVVIDLDVLDKFIARQGEAS